MPTKDCHYEDTVLSPTISYLVGRFFFFQEFLIGVWKKCTPSSIQAIFIAYLLCLVLKGHNWDRDIPKDNQQGRKRKLSTNIVTLWKHTRINDFAPKVHDLSEPVLHPSLLEFFFTQRSCTELNPIYSRCIQIHNDSLPSKGETWTQKWQKTRNNTWKHALKPVVCISVNEYKE